MRRMLAGIMVLCMLAPCAFTSAEAAGNESFRQAAGKALEALENALDEQRASVYVYRDFGDSQNHFTRKAKIWEPDGTQEEAPAGEPDGNWQESPAAGRSCIRCSQTVRLNSRGGWMFLYDGLPEGGADPQQNSGSAEGRGPDLTGTACLTFMARGENGGEQVEFFTCGSGRDAAEKISPGPVSFTKEWKEYTIDLRGQDLRSVACGFGFVMASELSGTGTHVFYLDEIRFRGDYVDRPCFPLLRSYDTGNIYIQNAAFSYDNALAAMAFLSAGRREEAEALLDAFVYAAEADRYLPGRVRNAYAPADILSFPGRNSAAPLPGWYDAEKAQWLEDRYQTGSNTGNTSYVALALLQYDAMYGSEQYLETARRLMDWVIENCRDGSSGFTAGCDGWPEAGAENTYVLTYKSIEHNIDAFAAFRQLYARTGEGKYAGAAESALELIRSLYDTDRGLFCTGTGSDGATPSTENIVLDAQVWACMALGEEFAPYEDALKAVEKMKIPDGGYPFCASNENGGWWAEGTAYTALMYRLRGEKEKAEEALKAMETIQLESGLFPAATVPNLSTGFGLFDGAPWEYGDAPHIAPTAWFVMAVNGFNPYDFSGKNRPE